MASDRLTIAAARPGMLVECTKTFHDMGGSVIAGRIYTVAEVKAGAMGGTVARLKETGDLWFNANRFIPADPPAPALTPGLIEALREFHATFAGASVPRIDRTLLTAIEAAGILDKPARPQPFHLTPQQFQEMWNVG